jgi:hypothetical protein
MSDRRLAGLIRGALAAVVAADLVSFALFVREARADALAHGVALSAIADLLSSPPATAVLVIVGVAAAVWFAGRPGRVVAGIVALAALTVLSTLHAELYGSPWRHLFFSGICLLGWLLGLAAARGQGGPSDESYAQVGSTALLGAAYLNSGISKIVYGGLDWVSGFPIQVIVVGQDGLVADGILSGYRAWVAMTPSAAAFFTIATLVFELSGPLMLVGRTTRAVVALGLLAMHANIYLLTDILYWESMVVLALFGLVPNLPPAVVSEPQSSVAERRGFAVAAVILALCAVLAIAHQGRRAMPGRGSHPASAVPTAAPSTGDLLAVGPFAVGQIFAKNWAVESLSLSDQGVVVAIVGTAGRARFELTCARSDRRSPFDLGPARIFYSSDLDLGELEGAGRALQAYVQETAGDGDLCASLASWRSGAGAGSRPGPDGHVSATSDGAR